MSGARAVDDAIVGALRFQRAAFDHSSLASPLYATLTDAALADIDRGGPCAEVLRQVPPELDPVPDAVALRFLGAVHRLVLEGRSPQLARWFPSAGGSFDAATDGERAGDDFVAAIDANVPELVAGLRLGVQTNEVGRCATLAIGFADVLRRYQLPLRLLELGASAGLNLRWDRWRYESGDTSWGDPQAEIVFTSNYREPFPDVAAPLGPRVAVVERLGCDRSPIDPTTEQGRIVLRSFVWPDQSARFARLEAALAAAAELPATVDAADAATWLERRIGETTSGRATVVYHSIVWQYLPPSTRRGIVDTLESAGAAATPSTPLAWLRMEPGDNPSEAAELRLRSWPGGQDRLLALTGYHGHPVWRAGGDPTTA